VVQHDAASDEPAETPVSPAPRRSTRGHGFVAAWNQSTQDAVKAGFLLPDDARHGVVGAQSDILQ
jgi:hypothetical protein